MKIETSSMKIHETKRGLEMRRTLRKVIIKHSKKTHPDPDHKYKITEVIVQWNMWQLHYIRSQTDHETTCYCGQKNLVKRFAIRNILTGLILFPIGSVCIEYFDDPRLYKEAKLFEKYYNKVIGYGKSRMLSGKYEGMLIKDVYDNDPGYADFIHRTRHNKKVDFDFGNYGKLSLYYHLKTNKVIYKSDEEEFQIKNE